MMQAHEKTDLRSPNLESDLFENPVSLPNPEASVSAFYEEEKVHSSADGCNSPAPIHIGLYNDEASPTPNAGYSQSARGPGPS